MNFNQRCQGEKRCHSLNKSERRVRQSCGNPNWVMITSQPRLWSPLLPPSPPFPGLPAFSVSLLMPFSSTLLGNICYGHQQKRKTETWENERKSLIRCPLGPRTLLHIGQLQTPWNVFILNPVYLSHPFASSATHVAKTHQRSSTYSSYPAKCSTLISNRHFWTRTAQSSATNNVHLILPPAASCYFAEYPEDENTEWIT